MGFGRPGRVQASATNTPNPTPHITSRIALRTQHPTLYTLHPKPCTLHPAPYTLHPSPYGGPYREACVLGRWRRDVRGFGRPGLMKASATKSLRQGRVPS